MGIQCSKRKHRPSEQNEIRVSVQSQKSSSTSKEAIAYCDSTILANYMRTKPAKNFLAEVIQKQQIQLDSCDMLVEVIKSKSEIILRCYNDYTEKALRIKLKVLEYYQETYQLYKTLGNDTINNQMLIQNETLQLLLETIIILNCLMDKNFDDEQEIWWENDYYQDRLLKLEYQQDTLTQNDKIVAPILHYINALKNKINQCIPNNQKQISCNQQHSVVNSVAIAQVDLTKFYDNLKLEFVRNVDEEQISH